MTAAAGPRILGMQQASPRQFPASTAIKEGWLVGRYPTGSGANAGTVAPIGTDPGLIGEGVARNASTVDSVDDTDVYCDEKIIPLFATGLDESDEGAVAYGVDNQTFSLVSSDGPVIGIVHQVDSATQAQVAVGRTWIGIANALNATAANMTVLKATAAFTQVQLAALGVGVKTLDLALGTLPANARIVEATVEGVTACDNGGGGATYTLTLGTSAGGNQIGTSMNVALGQTGFPKAFTAGAQGYSMAPQGSAAATARLTSNADLNTATAGAATINLFYVVRS